MAFQNCPVILQVPANSEIERVLMAAFSAQFSGNSSNPKGAMRFRLYICCLLVQNPWLHRCCRCGHIPSFPNDMFAICPVKRLQGVLCLFCGLDDSPHSAVLSRLSETDK